jgi:CBS domain-containing protein
VADEVSASGGTPRAIPADREHERQHSVLPEPRLPLERAMTCEEIMTPSPTCCSPDHTSVEAAELMQREDVGLVPVVDGRSAKLVGVITDRDITVKVVAAGLDPRATVISQVMTSDPVCCRPNQPIDAAVELMATRQVRRVPIVDSAGAIVGIISQADIATRVGNPKETAEVVQAISEPGTAAV